ncbi:nuclear transport factor 2 family protein [Chitinophaga pendula]|nr:hypothetical protein CK934_13100 [Chitinophaga sp. MD30]UCJ10278.1 nuclear transport factor 2 family protein [Chitinophaga pendula]
MTVQKIAERLVELCRKGDFETAQKELYAQDVVSIEPFATDNFEKESKGLDHIIEKGHKFESLVEEMHEMTVSDPLIAGNIIAFSMMMDLTTKDRGRSRWEELCVYTVKDGKIIAEQFFM